MRLKTAIIIPARYGSTRLPGKPLRLIAGQSLLQRVVRIALAAKGDAPNISVHVATDDPRIAQHCEEIGVACLMTPLACATGTDRVAYAVRQLPEKPDFILNLQGDAPLTPPDFLQAMIARFGEQQADLVTPVTQLSWPALDQLREEKKQTPFSGTTAVFNPQTGQAFWFSKTILPAIRNEAALRQQSPLSPVFRHIGLYGYAAAMLERYGTLSEGRFEALEGLEQLRVLEHGYRITCVAVDYRGRASMAGVDNPEDIARAEALIAAHGELLGTGA